MGESKQIKTPADLYKIGNEKEGKQIKKISYTESDLQFVKSLMKK